MRKIQLQSGVASRRLDYGIELVADEFGESVEPPDRGKSDAMAMHLGQFGAQVKAQQPPQGFDLGARALPVFDRESVQGQRTKAQLRTGLDGDADRLNAGAMARDAR